MREGEISVRWAGRRDSSVAEAEGDRRKVRNGRQQRRTSRVCSRARSKPQGQLASSWMRGCDAQSWAGARRAGRAEGRARAGMTHLLEIGRDDGDARAVRDVRVLGALDVSLEQALVGLGLQERGASTRQGSARRRMGRSARAVGGANLLGGRRGVVGGDGGVGPATGATNGAGVSRELARAGTQARETHMMAGLGEGKESGEEGETGKMDVGCWLARSPAGEALLPPRAVGSRPRQRRRRRCAASGRTTTCASLSPALPRVALGAERGGLHRKGRSSGIIASRREGLSGGQGMGWFWRQHRAGRLRATGPRASRGATSAGLGRGPGMRKTSAGERAMGEDKEGRGSSRTAAGWPIEDPQRRRRWRRAAGAARSRARSRPVLLAGQPSDHVGLDGAARAVHQRWLVRVVEGLGGEVPVRVARRPAGRRRRDR